MHRVAGPHDRLLRLAGGAQERRQELSDAVGAATSVPATVLGLPTLGRLAVDLAADLVVLNDNLEIESVFVGGEGRVVA